MRILQDIINKLDGYNPDQNYFEFTEQERDRLVGVLWDEVYGIPYFNTLHYPTKSKPLEAHYDILVYLIEVLHQFEDEDEYEICDVVNRLITITEDKIRAINKHYADTNKKS